MQPLAFRSVLGLVALGVVSLGATGQERDDLKQGFANPPDSAKPWVYWWWLDSNASKAGITRDLEEMKRQGIGGALIFDAGEGKGAPAGPRFMSAEWRELFKFAVEEARRLGIEISFNICSGWDCGGTWVKPEHACQKVVWSELTVQGPLDLSTVLARPPVTGDYYRDIAVVAIKKADTSGAGGKDRLPIKHLEIKSASRGLRRLPLGVQYERNPSSPGEADADRDSVVDLTKNMDQAGRLVWKVPEGHFAILRFGHTLLGARTKCTSPGGQGYEIDFLSSEALDMHFAATAEKLTAELGALAGGTLKYLHDDSWEVGNPNWTPRFPAEFKRRRGYDLWPYLPVLANYIVDSRDVSNRFLWDFRKTIGNCIADNHYGRLAGLARRYGMGIHPESGGPFFPHIDALKNLGRSNIPMGEFWARRTEPAGRIMWSDHYYLCDTIKQAASAAHIYGKQLCQAEAFTTMGPNWEKDPFMLKDVGDRALCQGLTRNVLCFYVHQPRLDIKPGYQWEAAGTHFDRNITWWNQIHAWLTYLSRCQFLLQQGLFVADVCYFYGEDVPNYVPAKWEMHPALPPGYDCDATNAEMLLACMSAQNGRIALPNGMSYRLLVLPERDTMSPEVLRKLAELVENGATVVGPRPVRAPGLTDYPRCDQTVKDLAARLWGACDGQSVKEHEFGHGKVIWGKSLQEILLADGIKPDFEYVSSRKDAQLDYIHRTSSDAEIYFVSNQKNRFEEVACTFRVSGRAPELWMPDTGETRRQVAYDVSDGRTRLPLRLHPRGSAFVVFREPGKESPVCSVSKDGQPLLPAPAGPAGELPHVELLAKQGNEVTLRVWQAGRYELKTADARTAVVEAAAIPPPQAITGPWRLTFPPGWGAPAETTFEKLIPWNEHPEEGIKYFSGTATYHKSFDLEADRQGRPLILDLGHLKNLAEVRLNGQELGVLWKPPFRVEITGAAQPGQNELEISITNLWPNRLIGDARLPEEKRFTKTNVQKFYQPPEQGEHKLLESGLMGPVRILTPSQLKTRF